MILKAFTAKRDRRSFGSRREWQTQQSKQLRGCGGWQVEEMDEIQIQLLISKENVGVAWSDFEGQKGRREKKETIKYYSQ